MNANSARTLFGAASARPRQERARAAAAERISDRTARASPRGTQWRPGLSACRASFRTLCLFGGGRANVQVSATVMRNTIHMYSILR